MSSVRILMLAAHLVRNEADSPWLMDDLATALVAQGVDVDVVLSDIDRPRPRGWRRQSEIGVLSVGPTRRPRTRAGRVLARGTAMLRTRRACRKLAGARHYDAVVFTSVASVFGRAPEVARRASKGSSTRSVYVLWDFFPTYHLQIGRLRPGPWISWLKRLEQWSMGSPDVTFVMSPANATYLRKYFGEHGRVEVQAPWSSTARVEEPTPSSRQGPFTAVFGGQLIAGRNVETLVDSAALIQKVTDEIRIVIAGSGPAEAALQSRVERLGLANVELAGALPRAAYGELLRAAHLGISTNTGDIDVPTFPTKIGEYCRYGRAMVIAAEEASDVGEFVTQCGAGVSVPAGDPEALASAILDLWRRWQSHGLADMEAAAWQTFHDHLSSEVAAEKLVSAVGGLETSQGAR
jgi:glycosyltransferase involved in cell wall biosynthesis